MSGDTGVAVVKSETLAIGIVLERREIDNPWQSHAWDVVAVVPGARRIDRWQLLEEGKGDDGRKWQRFHAATLTLEIHRRDTEGYLYNLSNDPPSVYVILREDEESDSGIEPFIATVCAYEAQAYLDGEVHQLEAVPMPAEIADWLHDFVHTHHVEEPRYKRKNKPYDPNKMGLGHRPPRDDGRVG